MLGDIQSLIAECPSVMLDEISEWLAIYHTMTSQYLRAPSVRISSMHTICINRGIVWFDRDTVRHDDTVVCLRVFNTSNGDIKSAAVILLAAPLMKAIQGPV
jgi:hypothetical protein